MTTLTLGFSPCPNDTVIFHALATGVVAATDTSFDIRLADVEELNRLATGPAASRLDVTKLSFAAYARVQDDYALLPCGGALGRGCGPLVIARNGKTAIDPLVIPEDRVAIPGALTTAALLWKLFRRTAPAVWDETSAALADGGCGMPPARPRVLRYDAIMPAVAAGDLDAGVIIHESRFTYADHGLVALVDLGEWWEQTTGLPIPLGCIAAKRSLGEARIEAITSAIRASLAYARANPSACRAYVREHAQETDDAVCDAHVALYVNGFTADYGDEGRAAIAALLAKAGR
jgi:1,4-dihydroxy-6-naphthoate synthase